MKTCLLCDHRENGKTKASPDVLFVCSDCVQKLVGTGREELAERYISAVHAGRTREAFALVSFVPKRVREEHPMPKGETIRKKCII